MCQLKTANFANTTELLNIKFLLKQKKYYATFVNEIGLFSLSRISFDGCNQHTHLSFNFTELNENIKVCWKTKLVVIIHENKKNYFLNEVYFETDWKASSHTNGCIIYYSLNLETLKNCYVIKYLLTICLHFHVHFIH